MLEYEKNLTEASIVGENRNLAASAGSRSALWQGFTSFAPAATCFI